MTMTKPIKLKIAGFHEIYGDIPGGSIILLIGEPGSGNDIFAIQTLYLHTLEDIKVSYLTIDRHPREIIEEMRAYGWNIEKVKIKWKFIDAYTNQEAIEQQINEMIENIGIGDWSCIDTITTMWMKLKPMEIMKLIRYIKSKAREGGGLHFLIAIKGIIDKKDEQILKHAVDGVFEFEPQISSNRGIIKIVKMRRRIGTWINIPYRITLRGIEIETVTRII